MQHVLNHFVVLFSEILLILVAWRPNIWSSNFRCYTKRDQIHTTSGNFSSHLMLLIDISFADIYFTSFVANMKINMHFLVKNIAVDKEENRTIYHLHFNNGNPYVNNTHFMYLLQGHCEPLLRTFERLQPVTSNKNMKVLGKILTLHQNSQHIPGTTWNRICRGPSTKNWHMEPS